MLSMQFFKITALFTVLISQVCCASHSYSLEEAYKSWEKSSWKSVGTGGIAVTCGAAALYLLRGMDKRSTCVVAAAGTLATLSSWYQLARRYQHNCIKPSLAESFLSTGCRILKGSGTASGGKKIEGTVSGDRDQAMVTRELYCNGLHTLCANTFGEVHLWRGDQDKVVVTASSDMLKQLTETYRDGRLHLTSGSDASVPSNVKYRVTLSNPQLFKTLVNKGPGDVCVHEDIGMDSQDLEIVALSSGTVRLNKNKIKGQRVTLKNEGSGDIHVNQLEGLECMISGSGSGSINPAWITAKSCTISLSGTSTLCSTVNISGELIVSIKEDAGCTISGGCKVCRVTSSSSEGCDLSGLSVYGNRFSCSPLGSGTISSPQWKCEDR